MDMTWRRYSFFVITYFLPMNVSNNCKWFDYNNIVVALKPLNVTIGKEFESTVKTMIWIWSQKKIGAQFTDHIKIIVFGPIDNGNLKEVCSKHFSRSYGIFPPISPNSSTSCIHTVRMYTNVSLTTIYYCLQIQLSRHSSLVQCFFLLLISIFLRYEGLP